METLNQGSNKIDQPKSSAVVCCSVCIATYRRPQLLQKLLLSLVNQNLPEGAVLEIIIVDNDSLSSAEPIVEKFNNSPFISFNYFRQPVKNISLTRNMAVEKAAGQYLLFIDDDEVASSRWVYHLLKTIEKFNADGVFGKLVPEFNRQTPEWMRRGNFFHEHVPTTGSTATAKWSGNCIIRASLLKKLKEPFDPRYGTTGGEDTYLFDKLERQGARFIYCREALVSEFIPPTRTRLSYLFLRQMQGGNTHTRRKIEYAGRKQIWMRVFMASKALVYGLTSLALMLCHFPSAVHRTRWFMKLASNIGRFLAAFGWHYQGYR